MYTIMLHAFMCTKNQNLKNVNFSRYVASNAVYCYIMHPCLNFILYVSYPDSVLDA